MTLTIIEPAVTRPASPLFLQIPLFLAATLELWDASSSLPVLYMDHALIPGPGAGGAVILATIVLAPLCALASIIFAAIGRLRPAITALACVGVCTWFSYLPSFVRHGTDVNFTPVGLQILFDTQLVLPIALAAIWLAVQTDRIGLATAAGCAPTVIKMAGLTIFIIAVMIHGF